MKKSLIQKYLVCLVVFVLTIGIIQKPTAAAGSIDVNAKAAILVDADTGKILFEKNSEESLGIASMTKMMTEYLLLEAVKEGKVKWNQEYTVSPELSRMSHEKNLSNVFLRVDGKYKVEDLYAAMAIESANAATIAIAEIVGGTEANFVKMMNEKAKELGFEKYKFVNSTGLNNRDLVALKMPIVGDREEENLMSAKDVATLAYRLLKDFPEVLKTSSIAEKKFAEGTEDEFLMYNWNWMLEGYKSLEKKYPDFQQFVYEGADGLKTGHTDFAGYCFTGTAIKNGQRVISVVMNTNSEKSRFTETRKLFDYAFNNFSKEKIIPKHYQVKGKKTLPVVKGKEDQVNIYTKAAVTMLVENGEKGNFIPELVIDKSKLDKEGNLTAPIKKGEKLGYLTIKNKSNDKLKFITDKAQKNIQVDVVAAEDVEKSNWFVLMMRGIGDFFGDLWTNISSTVKGWF